MNKKFIPVALVAVLLLAGLALWLGLRGNDRASRVDADITVFAPEETEIFVIEELETDEDETSSEPELLVVPASGELLLNLDNGTYKILANKGEEYYPWLKEVTVTGLFNTEVYPFFVSKEPTLEGTTDEEVLGAFGVSATLPTNANPRVNSDETAEMYVERNTVFISWIGEIDEMPEFICPGENVEDCQLQPFYTFNTPVENIEFYGDFDELLIADLGQTIVMVELDRRGTQNFRPLYIGSNPVAFRIIDGEVYVTDGGVVSNIVLD